MAAAAGAAAEMSLFSVLPPSAELPAEGPLSDRRFWARCAAPLELKSFPVPEPDPLPLSSGFSRSAGLNSWIKIIIGIRLLLLDLTRVMTAARSGVDVLAAAVRFLLAFFHEKLSQA